MSINLLRFSCKITQKHTCALAWKCIFPLDTIREEATSGSAGFCFRLDIIISVEDAAPPKIEVKLFANSICECHNLRKTKALTVNPSNHSRTDNKLEDKCSDCSYKQFILLKWWKTEGYLAPIETLITTESQKGNSLRPITIDQKY